MIVLCETRLQFYWNWHCSGKRIISARQKLEFVCIYLVGVHSYLVTNDKPGLIVLSDVLAVGVNLRLCETARPGYQKIETNGRKITRKLDFKTKREWYHSLLSRPNTNASEISSSAHYFLRPRFIEEPFYTPSGQNNLLAINNQFPRQMYLKGKTELILTISFNVRVKIGVREHYYSLRLTLISQTKYIGSIGQMKELEFIPGP